MQIPQIPFCLALMLMTRVLIFLEADLPLDYIHRKMYEDERAPGCVGSWRGPDGLWSTLPRQWRAGNRTPEQLSETGEQLPGLRLPSGLWPVLGAGWRGPCQPGLGAVREGLEVPWSPLPPTSLTAIRRRAGGRPGPQGLCFSEADIIFCSGESMP